MKHNVDSLKPVLLADVAMNNYSQEIISTLSAYDKILPERVRISYYLEKYKYLQQRFFKRFFNACRQADIMSRKKNSNDIAFDMMDSFEDYIKPQLEKLDKSIENFLTPLTNDPENIVLLRKIQMNNVLLQMSNKLYVLYTGKTNSIITDMLEINKMFIGRLDNRETKSNYDTQEIYDSVQELVNRVKEYQYEVEDL